MIRVVVFDFDGTLADTNGVKEACLHRSVAKLNGGVAALAVARQHGGDQCGSFRLRSNGRARAVVMELADRDAMLLVGDSADDRLASRAVGVKFAAVVAENRIAARGRFAVRNLGPLVPLIDSLNAEGA
jgi:phosphoglycolate phosphatase-like HAD superfamily hydrolase